MKGRILWLLQGSRPVTLQTRLFHIATLMAFVFSCLSLAVNLSIQMTAFLSLIGLFSLVFFAAIFYLSRFAGKTLLAQFIFAYGTLSFLNISYFANAGLIGSIPFLYFTLGTLLLAVLPRRSALIFWAVLLCNFLGMIFLEIQFPEWVTPYPSLQAQQLDLGLTALVALLIMGSTLYFFRVQYDQQHALLEKATLYKSQFLANMSHELRTPLNSVLGFARVLQYPRTGTLNPKQLEYLSKIQHNGMHLLKLVNDLLDLSRIEAGELRLEKRSVHLGQLLQELMIHFQPRIQASQLELILNLPQEPAILETDPHRLTQILNNLVDNAIKYTSSGQIKVNLFQQPQNLRLEIQDSGPGISPEYQSLIFQPFYQLESPNRSGAGLGLAITLQLCQLLGYQLSLHSNSQGSNFKIDIPLLPQSG